MFLCGAKRSAHVLGYSSKKCRRVLRSIMAGGLSTFLGVFDASMLLGYDLSTMFQRRIRFLMFTDSNQLFDTFTCVKRTTEKGVDD